MPDPLTQIFIWFGELIDQLAVPIAVAVGLYWAYLLYRRARVSSSDPSYRKFTSSALGSASFQISGAYLSALLAIVIAVVTWPAPAETPSFALILLGGVAAHAIIEKNEAMEAGS